MRKNNKIKLLYIDLFCGAGGTSTGVESATINKNKLAKVIACVNHDKNAIASHEANHPNALHYTEDIRTLDITDLVEYSKKMLKKYPGSYLVLWASLECTNFSKAKGGKSRDADSRTLAEHLYRYINELNPHFIQIENVEEFMSWGDVTEHGKPISRDKGKLYLRWLKHCVLLSD
ncbi:MAG: DNA cytosine methyltransferase [Ignavibacteriaceae bacterium]|nr:DNA cytosine methyltransferase [Ignavibacteriaceae bacterium]